MKHKKTSKKSERFLSDQKSKGFLTCAICKNKNLYKFLSLGNQPPSNSFLKEEYLNKPEIYYPLNVYFCEMCFLVQLGYHVDPKLLFKEYVYTTGTNNSLVKNFKELVKNLINKFELTSKDFAIDIGSNDGTLLKGYLSNNIKILGVEPSSAADIAIKDGIPTIKEFFNRENASKIIRKYGKAKIITATNVFAHVKELTSFIHGVKELLTDDGVFVCESHYLLNLIVGMQWDSIYHEHLRYYSLKPLIYLFNIFDMDLFDAERITTHGGSIRFYVCGKGAYQKSGNLKRLLKAEIANGIYKKNTYVEFGKKVFLYKLKMQEMLMAIRNKDKIIVGIGAPAKGNTFLNYCNITSDIMGYIVEKSDLKIGLYTPGMHLKVVSENLLFKEQPDYALLLSWNIADEIIPKLKILGYKGKIIVPLPSPYIVK